MSRAEVRCNLFRKEFHEGKLSGASCSGGSYSGKTILGTKVQVAIALREFHRGAIVQGDYLGVVVRGDKSPGANCPGRISRGTIVLGAVVQGGMSGYQ